MDLGPDPDNPGGYAPDLEASPVPLYRAAFASIVHTGSLLPRGMAVLPEFNEKELEALRHYIRQQARHEPSGWDGIKAVWNYIVLMFKMALAKHGWWWELWPVLLAGINGLGINEPIKPDPIGRCH